MRGLTITALIISIIAAIIAIWALTGGFTGGGTSVGSIAGSRQAATQSPVSSQADRSGAVSVAREVASGEQMTGVATGKDSTTFAYTITYSDAGYTVAVANVAGNAEAAQAYKELEDLALAINASPQASEKFKNAVWAFVDSYIDIDLSVDAVKRLASETARNAKIAGKTLSKAANNIVDSNANVNVEALRPLDTNSSATETVGWYLVAEFNTAK